MIPHITNDTFSKEVTQSTKPVVIDAYASWCGPCQHMAPIFEEIAETYKDSCTFFKLNVDEEHQLSAHLGISSIPTFIFFKNGTTVDTETGFLSKTDLEQRIKKLINS